jgi:AcrR family transcriptional regulator
MGRERERDRFATRAAILQNAAELVAAHGVGELRVNGLADAAGCDKVLIYRYFGGLDGVLQALGVERMLWPRVELESGEASGASLAQAVETLLLEEWAALAGGALMLAAGGAEVKGGNSLGQAVAVQRAARHAEMVGQLRERYRLPPYIDVPALVEILSAALTMFALRSARATGGDAKEVASGPNAIDPDTPQGWRRIERTLIAMTRALLEVDGS